MHNKGKLQTTEFKYISCYFHNYWSLSSAYRPPQNANVKTADHAESSDRADLVFLFSNS